MSTYTKQEVKQLVDGTLAWDTVHQMISMPKDADRYKLYMEVIQEKMSYKHKVIMALGPHLNLAIRDGDEEIHAFCDCGKDFGHYKGNWKLNANIYVRDTAEKMDQVYPRLMSPDTSWQVYREYSCPDCGTMLDIEAPTPWYMCMHDVQPDLKTFFEWVGIPAPKKI